MDMNNCVEFVALTKEEVEEMIAKAALAVVCSTIGHYNIPSSENILFSKVKYRTANNKLIPYIEMNFERVKQSIIKEIFIGPKSEVEVEDIVNLLSFYGYYDGIEGGYNFQQPVAIKKSSTTYR